tara:strand:- start:146 stop:415 length:270 start_codon:yes stop_codon:yes gene_type:complete
MRWMLLKAWPALIPIGIYLLWFGWRMYRYKKGDALLPDTSRPFRLALFSSLALLAICLITYGLAQKPTGKVGYEPKRYENGKLIEEEFH